MKKATPFSSPLYQVPIIIVEYMVLFYFSVLARYYPVQWQRLLAGTDTAEGYVFRYAFEKAAMAYVIEMNNLLRRVYANTFGEIGWYEIFPAVEKWYKFPRELIKADFILLARSFSPLKKWEGES